MKKNHINLIVIIIFNLINNYTIVNNNFYFSHPLEFELKSRYIYENIKHI